MSDALWPHELQHSRLPYLSQSPGVCSNSCQLSQWCHPTISSSASILSFFIQSSPASGSFPVSQLFASVAKVLELHLQHQYFQCIFRVDFLWHWLVWSPYCARTLKSLLQDRSLKVSILWHSVFFLVQLSHPYITTGKTTDLSIYKVYGKVMSLLFNMLSRFVIIFLSRSKVL